MARFTDFPTLFQPFNIGKMELKNRLVFSPVVSGHASIRDGDVTTDLVDFIGAQARTGVSMVHIGATPVDLGRARDFFGCLSATRDTDATNIRRLAEEAHRWDCKLSVELLHAGRIAQPEALAGRKAYVPWLAPDMDPDHFMQVGPEEIDEVVGLFVAASRRLAEAGCDQVLLHGAHGNFMSAFLSPVTNQRTDEYGGSFENRMRFPLRVISAVRAEIGNAMNIEYRISQNEYAEGTTTLEEVIEFLKRAAEAGIDSAHLSGGWIFDPVYIKYMMPSYMQERNLNIARTEIVHHELDIPVVCVGNIPNVEAAEEILVRDQASIVAMARNILADMDLVKKARTGKQDSVRPCLRCIECAARVSMGGGVRCSVNPRVGRETQYDYIPPAPKARKVLIIGGGPAGMQAAQTAVLRGHNVILCERDGELGGRLKEASALYKKADSHAKYLAWDIAETLACGADIRLNTEVTPEFAASLEPDVILVACGAEHKVPPIPGLDLPHVITVTEADLRTAPVGKRVAILGGGISGLECALDLAHDGYEVALFDQLVEDELWREVMNELRSGLIEVKEELGVPLYGGVRINAVTPEGIVYTDADGVEQSFAADTVVTSFGLAPNKAYVASMLDVVPEAYVIGDAKKPDKIYWANMDAFNIAVTL